MARRVVGKVSVKKEEEVKDKFVLCPFQDKAAACPYAVYNNESRFWECYEDQYDECRVFVDNRTDYEDED